MQIMNGISRKFPPSTKPNTDPTNRAFYLEMAENFGRHLVNMCGDHNTCGWTSILYQTHPEFQKTLEHSRKCSKLLPVFETRKAFFNQIDEESVKFLPEAAQQLQEQSAPTFLNPPPRKTAKFYRTKSALKAREPQKKTTSQEESAIRGLQSQIYDVCSKLYTIPDGTQAYSRLIHHIDDLLRKNSLPLELSTKIVEILSTFTPSEHLTKILEKALTHGVIDASLHETFLTTLQSPTTDPAEVSQLILERCEQIGIFVRPYLKEMLISFGDRGEKSEYTKEDLKKQQEALTRFHEVFCAPEVKSFAEMRQFLHEHLNPSCQLTRPIRQFLTEIETEKTNFMRLLGEIENLKKAVPEELKQQSLSKKTALTQEEIDFLPMDNEFLSTISQFLQKTIVLVECYDKGRGFEIFFHDKQLSIRVDDFDLSWEEFCKSHHWDDL